MSTDANTAASSAATDTLAPIADLATLSDAQRADWRKTGNLPAQTSDAATDSSTVPPVEQAASTDASLSPASESGTPSKETKGKGVQARKEELDADITELKEKLRIRAELREQLSGLTPPAKPDAPSDSSPTPAGPKFPEFAVWQELSGNPNGSYEDYLDQRADFRHEIRRREHERKESETRQQSAARERAEKFASRFTDVLQTEPDFFTTLRPEVAELRPSAALPPGTPLTAAIVLADAIVDSDVAPQLLRYLSDHPDAFKALVNATDRDAIVRGVGKLEAKLDAPPSSTGLLPPKTITEAPPPPPTLSSRAQAPVDEEQAALAAGDFTRYRAIANAKAASAYR